MDSGEKVESQVESGDLDFHSLRYEAFAGSYTQLLLGDLPDPKRRSKDTYGNEREKLLIGEVSGARARSKAKEEFKLKGNVHAGALRKPAACSRRFSKVKPSSKKAAPFNGKSSTLKYESPQLTSESSIGGSKSYKRTRVYPLEIPAGKLVVEGMTRFARKLSRPGVAVGVIGGRGTVCNLQLQGPWNEEVRVAGNAEIVTISHTFQSGWLGSTNANGTGVAITVAKHSGELCGGIVKGDMQAVGQVVLNVYMFS